MRRSVNNKRSRPTYDSSDHPWILYMLTSHIAISPEGVSRIAITLNTTCEYMMKMQCLANA